MKELAIPESAELARELPSPWLYQLEQAGALAREILDERVIQWTDEGKSQRWIADEVGCSHQAISKRQAKLDIEPSQPKRAASGNLVATSVEVVEPDEVLPPTQELAPRQTRMADSFNPDTDDVFCPTCHQYVAVGNLPNHIQQEVRNR